MFGYITVQQDALPEERFLRYRACYCGLCRALRAQHGQLCGLSLNYDMTFLILLLSSLYEPEETCGSGRCAPHPLESRDWWRNEFTDYAADMNVALMYHKLLDDWNDSGSRVKRQSAALLEKTYRGIREKWPRQCGIMERELAELARLEKEKCPVPDLAAAAFGRLMAGIFHRFDDRWTETAEELAFSLGKYIYLLDACLDMAEDAKSGSYNPLLLLWGEEKPLAACEELLLLTAGNCARAFERLPLVQDYDILKNILYTGMWTKYRLARKKQEGEPSEQTENTETGRAL